MRARSGRSTNVSIAMPRGTFTAVMGPSGSGKSTFLHCAAGLDRPTSGRVWLGEEELSGKKETALTVFRREHIGFVFQAYNLLGWLTVAGTRPSPTANGCRCPRIGRAR